MKDIESILGDLLTCWTIDIIDTNVISLAILFNNVC